MTPKWEDVDAGKSPLSIICLASLMRYYPVDNYMKLCTIEADLSGVPLVPQPKVTGKGSFYEVNYDIILLFGMTELKAQVAWKENVSGLHMFNQRISDFMRRS